MDTPTFTTTSGSTLLQTDDRPTSDQGARRGGRYSRFLSKGGRIRRIARWAAIPVVAIGLAMAADAPRAEAGGFSFSIGSGIPYGYGSSFRYRSGYGYHPYSGNRFYRGHHYRYGNRYGTGYRGYHPRGPHLHYHRPRVVPYRGRLNLVPGHYHLHRGRRGHH